MTGTSLTARTFNPHQPRVPGGEHGGEWTANPAGAAMGALKRAARALANLDNERPRTLPVGAPSIGEGDPPLTDYVPGRWYTVKWDRDAEVTKQVDGFIHAAMASRTQPFSTDEKQQIRAFYERQVPTTMRVRTVRNGPHEITYHEDELTAENAARLVDRVDQLQAIAPLDRVRIHVRDGGFVGDSAAEEHNVLGQTERGTGNIAIRPRAFDNWTVHPALRGGGNHYMPSAQTVDQLTYVLTHEWGHAADDWDNSQRIQMWGTALKAGPHGLGDISEYGVLLPGESLAEAFAEWVLSGGETTNQSTQAYAEHFRRAWGWRWAI